MKEEATKLRCAERKVSQAGGQCVQRLTGVELQALLPGSKVTYMLN